MTLGEFMDEAIRIATEGDPVAGERFVGEHTAAMMKAQKCPYNEGRKIVLGNIAYAAGYYSATTAQELRRFFRTDERVNL